MRFVGLMTFMLAAFALPAQTAPHRPVVMVHGFLASGDTWSNFDRYFRANGYPAGHTFVLDWNTLNQQADHVAALDARIDTVLARTGAKQVDLLGHSAGGGLCYRYLADSVRANKVNRYAHLGSSPQQQPAGRTPTLNVWSDGDLVVRGNDIPGAQNRRLPGLDHYQVATSAASFAAVFAFLNDRIPVFPDEAPAPESIRIGGLVVVFGDNQPVAGANIRLYYLDPENGQRADVPSLECSSDPQGHWHFDIPPTGSLPIELVVHPPDEMRPVHYFFSGFQHSSPLVYLRVMPPAKSMLGLMLAGLPSDTAQVLLNVFSADQAVIAGRDVLEADHLALSTEQHASAVKTAISFFVYDSNGNRVSDGSPAGAFGRFQFLTSIDGFIDAKSAEPLKVVLNDRERMIRRIPSGQGITVVVFD